MPKYSNSHRSRVQGRKQQGRKQQGRKQQCSCSAKMSPPNCSGKVSPLKLGGGLESKAATKAGGDRECGRRASECEGSGRSVGSQRAAGEAAQACLDRGHFR